MTSNSTDFKSYFDEFSGQQRAMLEEIYTLLGSMLPDADETISYQIPTFRMSGKNIVHFAAFSKHIGFYPTPEVIAQFEEELQGYKYAKGSVQFPTNEALPTKLIADMTHSRLANFRSTGK